MRYGRILGLPWFCNSRPILPDLSVGYPIKPGMKTRVVPKL
jgi:hypothetical protein